MTPYQRYEILLKLSKLIREKKEMLAETLSREVGKPIKEARIEVAGVAGNYENLAEEASKSPAIWFPWMLTQALKIVLLSPFGYQLELSVPFRRLIIHSA